MKQNSVLFMLLFTLSYFFSQSLNAQFVNCGFTVPANLSVFSEDGTSQFQINTIANNMSWSATTLSSWITINTPNGIGDGLCSISYSNNNSGYGRLAKIKITTCTGVSKNIFIGQIYCPPDPPIFERASKTEILAATVKVFPNPVSNLLNISLNEAQEAISGSLTDISGQVIQTFDLSNTLNKKLSVSNLPAGVYLLKIASVSKIILEEKIMIE